MINSGQNIIENEWNHVAFKVKKTTREVSFSLNNNTVSVNNLDLSTFSFNSSNQPLKIGTDDANVANTFKGEMDNLTIYDKAISHAQIEDSHSTFPILKLNTLGDSSVFKADVTLGESANTNGKNHNNIQNAAYNFDGSASSYVSTADQAYNGYKLNQMTLSAWINPSILTQNTPLLTKSLLQGQMQFGINDAKKIYFKINNKKLDGVNAYYDQGIDRVNVSATIFTSVPTNYYIMAFPYSKSPKHNIIDVLNTTSNHIIHNTVTSDTTINESLSNVVFDDGTSNNFIVVPKVHVYIVVSTHTLTELVNNKNTLLLNSDYIVAEKIVKFVSNVNEPYVHISDLAPVTSGATSFSASIFSSVMYISHVQYALFDDNVDLTNMSDVMTFINIHGTTISSSSTPINILKQFVNVPYSGNAFSDLSGTNSAVLTSSSIYKVAVMATYSNGMSTFKVLKQNS